MKAKSIYGNSPKHIKEALQLAMADHFKPTLAIAFISIKQDSLETRKVSVLTSQ